MGFGRLLQHTRGAAMHHCCEQAGKAGVCGVVWSPDSCSPLRCLWLLAQGCPQLYEREAAVRSVDCLCFAQAHDHRFVPVLASYC